MTSLRVTALLFALVLAGCQSTPSTGLASSQSAVSLPPPPPPPPKYFALSVPQLREFVYPTIGIENTFVGTRVAVTGDYLSRRRENKSKTETRLWGLKGWAAGLCKSEFCQTLEDFDEPISFDTAKRLIFQRQYWIQFAFQSEDEHQQFIEKTKNVCTSTQTCKIVVAGVLKHAVAKWGKNDDLPIDVVYVEVERIRVFNGDRNPMFELLSGAAKLYRYLPD